ncbi:hypothetical protein [Ruegeria sp. EL01]|uniref:hypothetical protein n=1 Tax=Ruegeria sp. EL01 TaxID=2107578 RepID=UPI000EA82FF0|nr:hypothetical protein [Ruegeria sp. EL01]
MTILRFTAWNALLILRRPIQFILRLSMFFSLAATVVGVVMIFTGTGNDRLDADMPFIVRLLAPVIVAATYFLWSGISYLYDSAVFRLTPEGRTITLFD